MIKAVSVKSQKLRSEASLQSRVTRPQEQTNSNQFLIYRNINKEQHLKMDAVIKARKNQAQSLYISVSIISTNSCTIPNCNQIYVYLSSYISLFNVHEICHNLDKFSGWCIANWTSGINYPTLLWTAFSWKITSL